MFRNSFSTIVFIFLITFSLNASSTTLKEEEKMIYEAMRDFATNELLPLSQNELNKKDEKLIRKLVEQMGELGFLGIDVPEKYGGSEMTKTGMCILAEGISFCGSPSFCTVWNVQTSIGSLGIIWYGNDEQKQRWLPGISSGEKIAAFGLTEPEAGSDATNSKTTGVLSDDGKHYILNGQKIFLSNGAANIMPVAPHRGENLSAQQVRETNFISSKSDFLYPSECHYWQGVFNSMLINLGLTNEPLEFLLFSDFAIVLAFVHLPLTLSILCSDCLVTIYYSFSCI